MLIWAVEVEEEGAEAVLIYAEPRVLVEDLSPSCENDIWMVP